VRGRDSIQREIFLGQRILSREGRQRSNSGNIKPEELTQSYAGPHRGNIEAERKSKNLLEESISDAGSQSVRPGGRNGSS